MSRKTAIIHARVSDRKQAERELSIPAQIEAGKKRAKELDAEVLHVFVEGKSRSAWSGNRPELEDAISFCEIHDVDYFITWDTARFSRNTTTGPMNRFRLRSAGTAIEYITVKIDPETDEGFILENIYQLTDELKSRQTSKDTIRSMIRNAKMGYWNGGRVPFGYRVVAEGKRKKLVPDENEAVVVVKMFQMKAFDGLGAKSIAFLMNEQGRYNRDRRWTKSVVGELLRNEVYIGKTIFGRRDRKTGRIRDRSQWVIVDSHEPIIEKELWDTVQARLAKDVANTEHGSPRSTFLFTGMMKCSICGEKMRIESAKGRNKRYWYYNCRAAALEKKHPSNRIPARAIDDYVVRAVAERVFTRHYLKQMLDDLSQKIDDWEKEHARKIRSIEKEIQTVYQKRAKLLEVLELHGANTPNLSDLSDRLREHGERIKRLESELAKVEAEPKPEKFHATEEDLDDLREYLTSFMASQKNPKKVRDFLSGIINWVVFDGEYVRIEYNPAKIVTMPPDDTVPNTTDWLPGTGSNRRPGD